MYTVLKLLIHAILKDHLEDLGMDGENDIKIGLQIQDWKVWVEFICFQI